MKSIVIVTHGFPPFSSSGVFRAAAFAKYLPVYGIQPIVLAAADSRHEVQQYPQSQCLPGISVTRVSWGLTEAPTIRSLLTQAGRVPIAASIIQWFRMAKLANKVVHEFLVSSDGLDKVSGVFATSPPPESLLIGKRLADHLKVPFWADLRDPWTYVWNVKYRSYLDFVLQRIFEQKVLGASRFVIANTPTSKDVLVERIGVRAGKIIVLSNGFDESMWKEVEEKGREDGDVKRFEVTYVGLVSSLKRRSGLRERAKRALGFDYSPIKSGSETRSPKLLLKAMEECCRRDVAFAKAVRLRWVGPVGTEQIEKFEEFRKSFEIVLEGTVTEAESLRLMRRANLLVLMQVFMRLDNKDCNTAVPGKLFNYLRSNSRIIAPVQKGDIVDILREFSGTRWVPVLDNERLVEGLLEEFRLWQNGKAGVSRIQEEANKLRKYDRQELTRVLAEYILESGGKNISDRTTHRCADMRIAK